LACPIQPLIAHDLPRQKISGSEKQEKCHEHWSIERDAAQTRAKHRISRFGRMTSLVVIGRPLLIEAKAQARQQLVDRGFILEMQEGLSLPSGETGPARDFWDRVEIEVGDHRGQISHVIASGPKTANVPRPTVGTRRNQSSFSPTARMTLRPQGRNALERPQAIIARPLDPNRLRWNVDQVQTHAQSVALRIRKLRRAAHEFTGENVAQRAFADIVPEVIGGRQQTAVVQSDPNAAPLGDAVYESHAVWRNTQRLKFRRGSKHRLAILVFYNFLPRHTAVAAARS
jgi:hypothetical protein